MLSLVPEVATLLARYDDGEDALHLRFRLEDGARWTARPGQFFMLSIPGLGEAAFTFVSLPDAQGCFTALVRQVGKLTEALQDLPLGTFVGVRGPVGQPWPELADQTVLVVAGGCGLAPLSAWLGQRLANGQAGRTALLYSARSEDSRILAKERDAWRQAGLPLSLPVDDPAWHTPQELTQATGSRLDAALALLPSFPDAVLCCGPEAMMLGVGDLLEKRGLSPSAFWLSLERRMHCGVGLCGHCYVGSSLICREGPTLTLARTRELLAQQVATRPAWVSC
ncbi:NAD(P)H-flavin reductase [Fluviicoccus keumensis]|uniref:NAD(P)H-flavin reductase n=1 Tax=Fluviicoccus keumensis TaxID=1435465 RepID=A0A4Q7YK30_9GAMM|nr:FAD-binding oxidoreductase [Fluviicoccus keumensis]RZU36845.1 NAD(P)H-flavin reductase [Fluviicoccus keumensis]